MFQYLSRIACVAATLGFATTGMTTMAYAELFEGCPSKPIMGKFIEFGRSGKMPPDLGKWLNTPSAQKVEPWKPFDNVDYVGICWVSSWLIHTDDGSVLIDTVYGPFTQQLVDNIKSTGTDLSDIKYVLITHGHFDHVGGAAELQKWLPNATFAMTQAGWDEAAEASAAAQGGRPWPMIEPQKVLEDGDVIELGGMKIEVIATPGHSWGTASYLFDVKDGSDTYRAITIGGLGLNAIEGPPQVEAYIDSVDRVRALVEDKGENVQVHLTTHGFSNNLEEDRLKLAERKPGEPNVFVNPDGLLQQVSSLRDRAVKRLEVEKNK